MERKVSFSCTACTASIKDATPTNSATTPALPKNAPPFPALVTACISIPANMSREITAPTQAIMPRTDFFFSVNL